MPRMDLAKQYILLAALALAIGLTVYFLSFAP